MNVILDREEFILEYLRRLLIEKINAKKIRIHGDLNLKQILLTGRDFLFTNFEGEPAVASSTKRLKRSPFRDISGIIGSVYFAAHTSLQKFGHSLSEDVNTYSLLADRWWFCLSKKFLKGYLQAAGGNSYLPDNKSQINFLINVYLIEKMLTEIERGITRQTGWLWIPVAGLKAVTNLLKI